MVLMSSWGLYMESIFQEISVVARLSPAMDKRQEQEKELPQRKDMQEFFLENVLRDAVLENVIRDAGTYTELQPNSNISLWETLSN